MFVLNANPIPIYFNVLIDTRQIPIALDMAKDFKGKEDAELYKKMDEYMQSAVIECYETLRDIIYGLLEDSADKT
jgi:callose synthase